MSSVPPPPPPPPGFPPAPPPPPPGPGGVPTGYVAYGAPGVATGAVRPSAGLGKATIVMFWLVTIATAFLSFALFSRKTKWNDFLAGNAGISDLNDADSLVGGVLLLQWAALLAAVIVLCLWSKRIADNAKARGVGNVSSGLACGGWFIPIGNLWVPWKHLRRAINGVRGSVQSLNVWQATYIVASIASGVIYSIRTDFDTLDDVSDVESKLNTQGIVSAVSAVTYALAAIFAMRAIKEADRSVSGNA